MTVHNLTQPAPQAFTSESNERIYQFLKGCPTGVLATVDPNGNPHAVVIYFSVDEQFTIRFTTKRDTKKHDNLQHNNHVMLLAYNASAETTVQVSAIAREVSDDKEAQENFRQMLKTAEQTGKSGVPPISKLYAGHYVGYELHPVQIRMAVFSRPDPGGYDIFETIDFKPQTS